MALGGAIILADAFDAPMYALFGWRATLLPGLPIARLLLPAAFAAAALLLAADRAGRWMRSGDGAVVAGVALAFVSFVGRPATTLLGRRAARDQRVWHRPGGALLGAGQSVLTAAAVSCIAIASALIVMLWPAFGPGATMVARCLRLQEPARPLHGSRVVAAAVTALSKRWRVPALLAVLLCGGVLLGSRSRASILSALVAIAQRWCCSPRGWRRQAFVILASSAVMTALAVAVLF